LIETLEPLPNRFATHVIAEEYEFNLPRGIGHLDTPV
jgi:hypothetical protein